MKYIVALCACIIWNIINANQLSNIIEHESFKKRPQKLIELRLIIIKQWLRKAGYDEHRSVKQFRNIVNTYLTRRLHTTREDLNRAKRVQSVTQKLTILIKFVGADIAFTKYVNQVLKSNCQDIRILARLRDSYDKNKPNEKGYWAKIEQRIKELIAEEKAIYGLSSYH